MFIIQNKFTKDFVDENGDWTMIRSLAKKFQSKEDIMKWIKSSDYKGSVLHCEPEFLKIVKEETKMKSFKEIIKEAVSTTSKREIANKADRAFAGYINDLKNALQDIKNNDYEWAKYRVEGVADSLKKLIPSLKEWGTLNKAGKLSESFPAAPSINGAFDNNDNYNKYVKASNEWKSKCQDKCNTLVAKIRRMAERFGADILDSVRNSLSNEQRTEALNELERIHNDLDRLMDKTKIKKN